MISSVSPKSCSESCPAVAAASHRHPQVAGRDTEGKPFTPAQALANGAVDEVVAPDEVVTRATELAEYFGKRTKGLVEAVKRSVYFGGSMPLAEGLHVERTEFLGTDQSKEGQELMLQYLSDTESTGEPPLPPRTSKRSNRGGVPSVASTNGAVSRS